MSGTGPSDSASPSGHDTVADDYAVLRHGVGVVPVARDVVRVSGRDALAYLQGQCSQDVEALEIGTSADALLLTPQGKLDALVRVTRAGEDDLYVDVEAGYGAAVITRLGRFKLRVQADIDVVDWRIVALRGPRTTAALGDEMPPGTALVVPYAWGGVTGVDLLGADPQVPAGVRRCGPEAWQTLRVEAGIPIMGAELDERTIAAEAGLLRALCQLHQRLLHGPGARGPARCPWEQGGPSVAGGGDRRGAGPRGRPFDREPSCRMADRVVGQLTSVAWSPTLNRPVALGYLHRSVEPPCAVEVEVDGAVRRSPLRLSLRPSTSGRRRDLPPRNPAVCLRPLRRCRSAEGGRSRVRAVGDGHGGQLGIDVQLPQDRANMRTDGGKRHHELRGDLPGGPAFHHVEEDFALGRGEVDQGVKGRRQRAPGSLGSIGAVAVRACRTVAFDGHLGHHDQFVGECIDVQQAGGTLFDAGRHSCGARTHTQGDDRRPGVHQSSGQTSGVLPWSASAGAIERPRRVGVQDQNHGIGFADREIVDHGVGSIRRRQDRAHAQTSGGGGHPLYG